MAYSTDITRPWPRWASDLLRFLEILPIQHLAIRASGASRAKISAFRKARPDFAEAYAISLACGVGNLEDDAYSRARYGVRLTILPDRELIYRLAVADPERFSQKRWERRQREKAEAEAMAAELRALPLMPCAECFTVPLPRIAA